MRVFIISLLLAGIAACGTKGSLQLPPGPPPEPLLGNAKSPTEKSAAPARTQGDVSTSKDTPR